MTDTAPLFPEIAIADCVNGIAPPSPNYCGYPFSLVAYWPRGGYWKIHEPLAFALGSEERIASYAKDLHERGWSNIHVLRLPVGAWPWNAQ